MPEPLNEVTFVGRLGTITSLRAERRRAEGLPVLIDNGEVEGRQIDPESGRYLRCDIRLNASSGRKLASGEMKRPENPEGRDPRAEGLRADARRKAVARGLPFYFTCNMAEIVLYEVARRPGQADQERWSTQLAPVQRSSDVASYWPEIEANWIVFLNELERWLSLVETARPSVTTADVILLRNAIDTIVEEAIERTIARVSGDQVVADQVRAEAFSAFGFSVALNPAFPADFRRELEQVLRLGAFVIAQKLVLYRVLSEAGPKRAVPFELDELVDVRGSTDPEFVRDVFRRATAQAIGRSGDYETAFEPRPLDDVIFLAPVGIEEIRACRVGEVWQRLINTVSAVSWEAISRNLVGFLYEAIVDPEFRHELGQYYTREDVVDILVTFAVREQGDLVADPACGGGSFLRSAYERKRALGDSHDQALADLWGFEITAFAAELSTVALASADTTEPAAYPRVLLRDFFDVKPRVRTELQIPGTDGSLHVPEAFDAIVGNPPYISYRRQTNQNAVARALATEPAGIDLPAFSGKSDEYVWFLVHATGLLRDQGRLGFVVSSAILFSDYGIPLTRFLGRHYRICAVVDSIAERWFPDADTNTVLLLLERETDPDARRQNTIRFLRLRRPLAQLLDPAGHPNRRAALEDLVERMLTAEVGPEDEWFQLNAVPQGQDGGLQFAGGSDEDEAAEEADEL
jgi:N-6 DNA Methylase